MSSLGWYRPACLLSRPFPLVVPTLIQSDARRLTHASERDPTLPLRRLDVRLPVAHASGAPLPPFTPANGWQATGNGGSRGRLGTYGSVGNKPLTRVGRDRVCERTPFLHATSGNPPEGTRVAAGPAIWRNCSMKQPKPPPGGHRSTESAKAAKAAQDNRSRQLNPEHSAYWRGRGMQYSPSGSGNGARAKTQKR